MTGRDRGNDSRSPSARQRDEVIRPPGQDHFDARLFLQQFFQPLCDVEHELRFAHAVPRRARIVAPVPWIDDDARHTESQLARNREATGAVSFRRRHRLRGHGGGGEGRLRRRRSRQRRRKPASRGDQEAPARQLRRQGRDAVRERNRRPGGTGRTARRGCASTRRRRRE